MSYYYVKNGGSATGDAGRAATKRTGTFATMGTSAYYDSIYDVIGGGVPTTALVDGDFILCASDHAHTYTVDTKFAPIAYAEIHVSSVDVNNAEDYLAGAAEVGTDLTTNNTGNARISFYGVSFATSLFLYLAQAGNSHANFYDCGLELTSTNANYYIYLPNKEGASVLLKDTSITFAVAKQSMRMGRASLLVMDNITLLGGASDNFIGPADFGAHCFIRNTDLSSVTNAISLFGSSVGDDHVTLTLERCLIGSAVPLSRAPFVSTSSKLKATSIDMGDGYHYFEEITFEGTSSEETGIYRTSGATYDGTNQFCVDMTSSSNASYGKPLEYGLGAQYIDTADYTTNVTFTVHFAVDGSSTALNSDEVWMEVEHVDGADNALGVLADTKAAILATGTAPTTETSLWTGLGGTNKQMSVSVTVAIGTTAGTIASGLVRVKAYLGKASKTVFVCPQVEVS